MSDENQSSTVLSESLVKETSNPTSRLKKMYLKKIEKEVPLVDFSPTGPLIIPKIIHQIWIGSPLPDKFKVMVQSWKDLHLDWEYYLWTDEAIKDFPFVNRDKFMQAPNWGAKADILRYEILEKMGGVYIDIDYECLKPLDQLHYKYQFYTCDLNGECLTNALIGSIPHHPILKSCVENLKNKNVNTKNYEEIMAQVGPAYFTKQVYNYIFLTLDPNLAIFKKEFSFPMSSDRRFDYWQGKMPEAELEKYRKSNAFALHYWATSWQVK